MSPMTDQERHVMEHATGWKSKEPLYRNRFVTGPETTDWPVIQALVKAGLMRVAREPSELSGGDWVFAVTPAGLVELERAPKKRKAAK